MEIADGAVGRSPQGEEMAAGEVVVQFLSGKEVLRLQHIPVSVLDLKHLIAPVAGIPVALQKLLRSSGLAVCHESETLRAAGANEETLCFLLIHDETPLWHWSSQANASAHELDIEGAVVRCPRLTTDYTNVLTQEAISSGLHYFEFHLHHYGDEQWCGLTPNKDMGGPEHEKAVPSKTGYMYYTGRRHGAIEAVGFKLKDAVFMDRDNGSVIGMLVDCDEGAVAFDVNGSVQGACSIPVATPLWLLTHLDDNRDHVELRKPCLQDAPPDHFDALKGALLQVSEGQRLMRSY